MVRDGAAGGRKGRYTEQVVETLRASGAASAQELFSRLRSAGSPVGLTTVYRELRVLTVRGTVRAVPLGPETVYEVRSDAAVVDAALCVVCGRRERVPRGADAPAVLAGDFLTPDEPVVVQGVCRTCVAGR